MPTPKEIIRLNVQRLIDQAKLSIQEVKTVAIAQAWKILQLAVASIVQVLELTGQNLTGPEKKILAMDLLSQFYDSVFTVISIPFVPAALQPIIQKYVKSFLMILVGATIDAMVTTFRSTGVFVDPNGLVTKEIDIIPKVSEK